MPKATIDWSVAKPVPTFGAMDERQFKEKIASQDQPAVLRQQVADWPLVAAGRQGPAALCDMLKELDAGKPIKYFTGEAAMGGRFFYADDLRSFNFERQEAPLSTLLARLGALLDKPHSEYLYAGAIPVPEHFPALLDQHHHGLLPPGQEHLVSLWLGHHSRTAAHFDLPQNLACVVAGRRRFILLPISQLSNLYLGPLDHTLAGQPVSLVDFLQPDYEQHPGFQEAVKHALVAELAPGDALYIPSLWFHHVETLDPLGAMLNFWWRDGPAYMFTPMITLMHSLLSIRDLPAREREAWRTVFDHYIFQRNGDPMAHLPESARGIFGEMTPEKLRRLKYYLGQSLS